MRRGRPERKYMQLINVALEGREIVYCRQTELFRTNMSHSYVNCLFYTNMHQSSYAFVLSTFFFT